MTQLFFGSLSTPAGYILVIPCHHHLMVFQNIPCKLELIWKVAKAYSRLLRRGLVAAQVDYTLKV